jgi:hypothetical protein
MEREREKFNIGENFGVRLALARASSFFFFLSPFSPFFVPPTCPFLCGLMTSQRGESGTASSSKLTIERLSGSKTTYSEFLSRNLIGNRPCLLSPSLTADWNAFHDWKDSDRQVNDSLQLSSSFERLAEEHADHKVPVIISNLDGTEDVQGVQEERKEMSITDAIALMKEGKKKGDRRVYIKDWHLIRLQRQKRKSRTREPYEVPSLFADDCEGGLFVLLNVWEKY